MNANYVTNRVPQRGRVATPYQAFHGNKPDVGHLRVFGCKAWVYTPADIRRKLEAGAQADIFLGYGKGQLGYRVRIGPGIVTSRDVHFDESTTPVTVRTAVSVTGHEATNQDEVTDDIESADLRDTSPAQVGGASPEKMGGPPPAKHTPDIEDAVAVAQKLVRQGMAEDENESGSSSSEPEESKAHTKHDTDGDASGGSDASIAPTKSRHPTRLLRVRPAQTRAYATKAWIAPAGAAILAGSDGQCNEDGRVMRAARAPRIWEPNLGRALATNGASPDKMRMDQAKREPDWPDFDKAIKAEVDALWSNGTWKLVNRVPGMKITPTTMLCERKRGAAGEVTRHEGRYVVRGDKQEYMVDYLECFAPVARHTTLRALLAMVAADGMAVEQMDVETAFLNGDVEESIYVEQPRGYERGNPSKVCMLIKALYGLKQAARQWFIELADALNLGKLLPCASDPCLFKGTIDGVIVLILVYVDDLLIVATTQAAVTGAKKIITTVFKSREMGEPTYFLGLHIDRKHSEGTIKLGQRQYVSTLLERFWAING